MSDIDDKIRNLLNNEDKKLIGDMFEEQSLTELVADSFKGRLKYMVIMVWTLVPIFFAAAVYCAVEFFYSDSVSTQIGWIVGVILNFQIVSMLKIWYWMELNKQVIRRDIKRLELRLVNIKS